MPPGAVHLSREALQNREAAADAGAMQVLGPRAVGETYRAPRLLPGSRVVPAKMGFWVAGDQIGLERTQQE